METENIKTELLRKNKYINNIDYYKLLHLALSFLANAMAESIYSENSYRAPARCTPLSWASQR